MYGDMVLGARETGYFRIWNTTDNEAVSGSEVSATSDRTVFTGFHEPTPTKSGPVDMTGPSEIDPGSTSLTFRDVALIIGVRL